MRQRATLAERLVKSPLLFHALRAGHHRAGHLPEFDVLAVDRVAAHQAIAAARAGHALLCRLQDEMRLALLLGDDDGLRSQPHQLPVRVLE
jgi:hypothetical protein